MLQIRGEIVQFKRGNDNVDNISDGLTGQLFEDDVFNIIISWGLAAFHASD